MLINSLRWLYNLVAIKFFFILLCLGALTTGPLLIPLRIILPKKGPLITRRFMAKGIRLYFAFLNKAGLLSLKMNHIEPKAPSIYISNHNSLLDALYYMAYFPGICAIIKKDLFYLSPFAIISYAANYIGNNSNENTVDKVVSALKSGQSIFIFPDGTRRPQGENINLKRGAVMMALKSQAPLIYGKIKHSEPILGKNSSFLYAPKHLIKAEILFHPIPDSILNVKEGETIWLASRRISKELEIYLNALPD